MKKIILLLVTMGFVMFCSFALAQGWNSTVTTTINEPNLDKMDLFTNKDGNHILIKRSDGTIIYYNINSSGTVNGSKTETLASSGDFPNITGYNNKIYAIYKSGNYIKGKYSTNGGTDWSPISDLPTTSNTCNGVDAVYEIDRGVHVVWATKDSDPYYETYYYLLHTDNTWVNGKTVTDYDVNEVGGFPTVTFSTDRVHVSYNTGYTTDPVYNQGSAKTRDKYTTTWQTPQLVFGGGDGNSGSERAFSDNSYLFDFYYKFISDMGGWHFDLYAKNRTVGGTTWSSPTLLDYYSNPGNLATSIKTNDGKVNIVYEYLNGSSRTVNHRSFNGSSWSSGYGIASGASGYKGISLTAVSNDLFVTFKESSSNYVKYRQYDALPLAPTNTQLSANPGNGCVRFSWTRNNEPDIALYEVWRKVTEMGNTWQSIGTTSNTYFVDQQFYYAPGAGDFGLTYKVRAKDVGNYYSSFSSEVSTRGEEIGKKSVTVNPRYNFELQQNYPNPFNPTTKIRFSVPCVGAQCIVPVQLKVYDVLGNEVATLVNEEKPEGIYEVEFDASNLPSGIYFYKMQAGNFTAVNKMVLMW